jgi:hypothetical protein
LKTVVVKVRYEKSENSLRQFPVKKITSNKICSSFTRRFQIDVDTNRSDGNALDIENYNFTKQKFSILNFIASKEREKQ